MFETYSCDQKWMLLVMRRKVHDLLNYPSRVKSSCNIVLNLVLTFHLLGGVEDSKVILISDAIESSNYYLYLWLID